MGQNLPRLNYPQRNAKVWKLWCAVIVHPQDPVQQGAVVDSGPAGPVAGRQRGLRRPIDLGNQLRAAQTDLDGLLRERRGELKELSPITRYVCDMRSLLQESSRAERKAFIKSFVKEIVVTGEEAVLRYTLPLPPEGGEAETLPNQVLASIRYGGPGWCRTIDLPVMSRLLYR